MSIEKIVIYCDGGSRGNPGPAGIGAVILDDRTGEVIASVSEHLGNATNNVAEYTALVRALESAEKFGANAVSIRADSELLIKQLRGEYKVKNKGLKPLYARILEQLSGYKDVSLEHVRREFNTDADALVNAALDAFESK